MVRRVMGALCAPAHTRPRERQALNTLKVERNATRAPIWWPRAGLPVQLAMELPGLPFHGDDLRIDALTGVLTTGDLAVFAQLCTRYLARRPSDRRLEVSLTEVAGWLGARTVGGEQRRMARDSLSRLLGATFTSRMRWSDKASQRWVEGWHLVDRWVVPEGSGHTGALWLSQTITSLLAAGSVVLLDSRMLTLLMRRSVVAARLWMYLEADSLSTERAHMYAVFDAPPGQPARQRRMAALADMLRLTDKQRGQIVMALRKACGVVCEIDPRYRLTVDRAVERHMWNLVAMRHRSIPLDRRGFRAMSGAGMDGAIEATSVGDPGNDGRASEATRKGGPGNAAPAVQPPDGDRDVLGKGAIQATMFWLPDGPSKTGRTDGRMQTMPVASPRTGTRTPEQGRPSVDKVRVAAIARDREILADPDAPEWKREAAAADLAVKGERR